MHPLVPLISPMMAEVPTPAAPPAATAVEEAPAPAKTKPRPHGRVEQLPPYRVLLHNDDHNEMGEVIGTLTELTPLNRVSAIRVTLEAETTGVALVLVTHKERAELYQDQFTSRRLTVTIEPAD